MREIKTIDDIIADVKDFIIELAKTNNYEEEIFEKIEKVSNDLVVYQYSSAGERFLAKTNNGYGFIYSLSALGSYYGKPLTHPTILINKNSLESMNSETLQVVSHELFHAFSDNIYQIDNPKNGLSLIQEQNKLFEGINEGFTEYLTEEYLKARKKILCRETVYFLSKHFAKLLTNKDGLKSKYVKYYFSRTFDPEIFGELTEFLKKYSMQDEMRIIKSDESSEITEMSEKIIRHELKTGTKKEKDDKKIWFREYLDEDMFIEADAMFFASTDIQIPKGDELCIEQ